MGLMLAGCVNEGSNGAQAAPQANAQISVAGQSPKASFGQYYQPTEVEFTADAPGYELPLDLSKVVNESAMRRLSPEAKQMLAQNGFVVTAAGRKEDMAEVYDDIEEADIPVYVTADSLLHVYHIQFDETLKDIEEREFYEDLYILSNELKIDSADKYAMLTGNLKEAARRNRVFFLVGERLLELEKLEWAGPDPTIAREYTGEMALIEAHQGFASSPLFHYKEDYSQYVPRGHYTRSENLKKYFKAMMWYGRMAFLLKGTDLDAQALVSEEDARIQTLQACLIAHQLDQRPDLAAIWNRIYQVTAFYVGLADDLTPPEYAEAIEKVYGTAFAWKELAQPSKLRQLKGHLASLRSPQIYGGTGNIIITPPFSDEDPGQESGQDQGDAADGPALHPRLVYVPAACLPQRGEVHQPYLR